jgi:hypothetical protein
VKEAALRASQIALREGRQATAPDVYQVPAIALSHEVDQVPLAAVVEAVRKAAAIETALGTG